MELGQWAGVALHHPVIESKQICACCLISPHPPGIWLGYHPASSLFSLSDSVCCGQSCLARGYALWLCSGKPVSHLFIVCWVKNVRPLLELLVAAKRNAGSQHRHIPQCPLWAVGYSDCQSLLLGCKGFANSPSVWYSVQHTRLAVFQRRCWALSSPHLRALEAQWHVLYLSERSAVTSLWCWLISPGLDLFLSIISLALWNSTSSSCF